MTGSSRLRRAACLAAYLSSAARKDPRLLDKKIRRSAAAGAGGGRGCIPASPLPRARLTVQH